MKPNEETVRCYESLTDAQLEAMWRALSFDMQRPGEDHRSFVAGRLALIARIQQDRRRQARAGSKDVGTGTQ